MSAINARELAKRFAGNIQTVDGIDLAIPEGQPLRAARPHGSGKTTTVGMLTTLLRPTAGHADVGRLDITRQPDEVQRRIGVAL